jgi:hypothetical protein
MKLFKVLFLLTSLAIFTHCGFNQNKLVLTAQLPSELKETSALTFYNNAFWTINDSGGKQYYMVSIEMEIYLAK